MSDVSRYDEGGEPTEAEHFQARPTLGVARGRYPGLSDEPGRSRLAEACADSPDDESNPLRQRPDRLAAPLASGVLRTARKALDMGAAELAAASGCAVTLGRRIESGDYDPALDTQERILNASASEIRSGHRSPTARTARWLR